MFLNPALELPTIDVPCDSKNNPEAARSFSFTGDMSAARLLTIYGHEWLHTISVPILRGCDLQDMLLLYEAFLPSEQFIALRVPWAKSRDGLGFAAAFFFFLNHVASNLCMKYDLCLRR